MANDNNNAEDIVNESEPPSIQFNCGGVSGLILVRNFITIEEEQHLLEEIDKMQWSTNKSRRVQFYVPWRDDKLTLVPKDKSDIVPLPPHAVNIAEKILAYCHENISVENINWKEYPIADSKNTEMQVNEYDKNSSLRYHFDNTINYKEVIFGVSIGCDCCLYFANHAGENKIIVPARSLYLMTGKSRYQFKHGIKENSLLNGDRRISLTYRTIIYGSPSSSYDSSQSKSKGKT